MLTGFLPVDLCGAPFTLTADFPAGVDWSESLYTDEGWYAGGAITHTLTGTWIVPGDFKYHY